MLQRFFDYIDSIISSSGFKNEKEGKVRISFKYVLISIILGASLGIICAQAKFRFSADIFKTEILIIYIAALALVFVSAVVCIAWKIDYDEYEIVYRTWYFRKYTFSYHDIRKIYTGKAFNKCELTTDTLKITLYDSSMSGVKTFIEYAKKNTSSSITKI